METVFLIPEGRLLDSHRLASDVMNRSLMCPDSYEA